MNEIVFDLAQKAEEQSFVEYSKRLTGKTREAIMLQKFAELIVQECTSLVDDYVDARSFYRAGDTIREHFGVTYE